MNVINILNPIEELYDLYSKGKKTLWNIEIGDNGLG